MGISLTLRLSIMSTECNIWMRNKRLCRNHWENIRRSDWRSHIAYSQATTRETREEPGEYGLSYWMTVALENDINQIKGYKQVQKDGGEITFVIIILAVICYFDRGYFIIVDSTET